MTIAVTHSTIATLPDEPGAEVNAAEWNANHALTGRADGAQLMQGAALSVLGVAGNATADQASIAAASDKQVLRRNGTSIGFGAIDLASSDAVSGLLAPDKGGTGANGFTAGRLLIGNGTGAVAVATDDELRWDTTNHRLGINITPTKQLDILGRTGENFPMRVRGAAGGGFYFGAYSAFLGGMWPSNVTPGTSNFALIVNETGNATIFNSSGRISLSISDVTKLNVHSSGNVGIGIDTAAPASRLQVAGTITPGTAGSADLGSSTLGWRQLFLDYTNTATVGDVTMNKASGTVNLGAAGTTLTLTNSLITANSRVMLTLASNPGVAIGSLYAVPAAGSCTINVTTAVVNQTKISFEIIN